MYLCTPGVVRKGRRRRQSRCHRPASRLLAPKTKSPAGPRRVRLLATTRHSLRHPCRFRTPVSPPTFLDFVVACPLRVLSALAMEDVPGTSGPSRAAASVGGGGSAAGGSSAGAASSAGPSGGGGGSKSTAGAVGPPSAINTVALPPKPQFPALSGKALPVRVCGWNPVGICLSVPSVSDWSACCSSLVCTVSDIVFDAFLLCVIFAMLVRRTLSALSLLCFVWYVVHSVAVRVSARSPSPPTATPHCRPSGCPSMSRWCSSSSCRCG